jgi:hypothetical protein
MRRRIAIGSLAALAVIALAGCAGATIQSAAPASVAASVAPTEAPPSEAAASDVPSFAIPSFAFPSTDKELEALLPNTICGETVLKFSFSGASFVSSADPEFVAIFGALGKTANDVTLAAAGGASGDCTAGIFRVKGADANQFRDVFMAEMTKEGITVTEESLGGKTVLLGSDPESFQYGYFKGDALIFFTAPDEAKAAELAASLP